MSVAVALAVPDGAGTCSVCRETVPLRATNTGPIADYHDVPHRAASTCAGSMLPPAAPS